MSMSMYSIHTDMYRLQYTVSLEHHPGGQQTSLSSIIMLYGMREDRYKIEINQIKTHSNFGIE